MRSVDEHRDAVQALLARIDLGSEELPLSGSALAADPAAYRDRVLAEDQFAGIDLPPFDNSQMDGYAVRAADLAGSPVALPVAGVIAAGDVPADLAPGTVLAIMTGAAIPAGADAVVPIERADPPRFHSPGDHGGGDHVVRFSHTVVPGEYVRERGSDLAAGDLLLKAGTVLTAPRWGALASAGVSRVRVRERVRVLVISTGQELTAPGHAAGPGRIHDANSVLLASALTDSAASVRVALVPDSTEELLAVLRWHAPDVDLVLTTGGVSAGAFEVVRQSLEPLGVGFDTVAMQPGGPQGLGIATVPATSERLAIPVPVICFPGNPVSALVSFEMFLRPVLRRLAGLPGPERATGQLPLAGPLDSPPGKHQVRRGRVDEDGRVHLLGGPGSHLLHAYARSNVLVHVPVGVSHLDAASPVTIWRIDG